MYTCIFDPAPMAPLPFLPGDSLRLWALMVRVAPPAFAETIGNSNEDSSFAGWPTCSDASLSRQ